MAHIPAEELFQMIEEAKQKVKVGSIYYHYKHPEQLYTLVDVIIVEASDEIGVLYRAEYEPLNGITFMRPIEDFLAVVEVEGKTLPRFTLIK